MYFSPIFSIPVLLFIDLTIIDDVQNNHFYSLFIDINECGTNTHHCHTNAQCSNSIGTFSCACNIGYSGDGKTCSGNE